MGFNFLNSPCINLLYRYGIEFLTLRPLDLRHNPNPLTLGQHHRVPLAPESGKYYLHDYEKYELERERFFDSPGGGIAGRSGGTVARLWRKNHTRFNERVSDVNNGPSEVALSYGVKVSCGENKVFYDDYLSSDLEGFICGQYLARQGCFSL